MSLGKNSQSLVSVSNYRREVFGYVQLFKLLRKLHAILTGNLLLYALFTTFMFVSLMSACFVLVTPIILLKINTVWPVICSKHPPKLSFEQTSPGSVWPFSLCRQNCHKCTGSTVGQCNAHVWPSRAIQVSHWDHRFCTHSRRAHRFRTVHRSAPGRSNGILCRSVSGRQKLRQWTLVPLWCWTVQRFWSGCNRIGIGPRRESLQLSGRSALWVFQSRVGFDQSPRRSILCRRLSECSHSTDCISEIYRSFAPRHLGRPWTSIRPIGSPRPWALWLASLWWDSFCILAFLLVFVK